MQVESPAKAAVPCVVAPSSDTPGRMAAQDVAADLRSRLTKQQSVRIILAAAPSQAAMLEELRQQPDIDWSRVTAFHMDEYLGLPAGAPQRFAIWLDRHFFDHVPLEAVHRIQPGPDPSATADAYAALLGEAPIDIVCCGIGSNGHLAFNDPPADLADPRSVRVVTLDDECRQQQVDDQCFAAIEDVPTKAITLTVPRLLAADRIFCCVPGALKMRAVTAALTGPLTEMCPASALRTHKACTVYLDMMSAAGLSHPDVSLSKR